jgi:HrpA-like RNA helicase
VFLKDYCDAAVVTVLQIHLTTDGVTYHPPDPAANSSASTTTPNPTTTTTTTTTLISTTSNKLGDILVFLTGSDEIESVCETLQARAKLLPPHVPRCATPRP